MDIYNKEFKTTWKGYNRDQVDAFLDQIILDFKSLLEGDGEVQTSPDDVRLKQFPRTARGYDPDDVDAFLLEVAGEYAELLGQRRRAEEAARARRAGIIPVAAPEPAPPAVAPPESAPPEAVPPEPAPPAVAPVRHSLAGLPVELLTAGGAIRLSLSGGRVFLTMEAQDLTVRKELDADTARRLGEALLRLTDPLGR